MPYDPQWPQNGQNIDADRFRSQFGGLFDLINQSGGITAVVVDAVNTVPAGNPASVNLSLIGTTLHFSFNIPQGQEGAVGPMGPPFSQAVVDAVNTLNPGDPASVGVSFDGSNVRFVFGIPRGNDGSQGPQGNNGSDGQPGAQGPQGPPFASAVVDGVTTLDPWQPATVQTIFDGSNVRFQFGIPRGNDGMNGAQGPPGEVSQTDLNNGLLNTLNQCSNVSNGVSTITNSYTDPEAEELRQKVNELIAALRR
jgi:hypothetical protein